MDMGGQGAVGPGSRNNYRQMLEKNIFLATLSDGSTFQDAVNTLYKYDAWNETPRFIQDYFLKADTKAETVKYDEYETFNARVFGLTPKLKTIYPAMYQKARELGYTPLMLSESITAEAKDAGLIFSSIAQNIQNMNEPVKAPCVLISSGELVVTVGKETGVGGRNQEFCVYSALTLAGSSRIVVAAVDTDGTDGPGGLSLSGAPNCLAGAVIDGFTLGEAKEKGIDLEKALKTHGVSEPLWLLNSGIAASQSISVLDLRILLIMS
jgi:glycerate-2-kinase